MPHLNELLSYDMRQGAVCENEMHIGQAIDIRVYAYYTLFMITVVCTRCTI